MVNELAERGLAFAIFLSKGVSRFKIPFKVVFREKFILNVLVSLPPLGRRTYHPLIPEVLAHGFSPAPAFSVGVGSSTFRDGWALASLIC